jgi:cell wall-associated NlpC family hydrolase
MPDNRCSLSGIFLPARFALGLFGGPFTETDAVHYMSSMRLLLLLSILLLGACATTNESAPPYQVNSSSEAGQLTSYARSLIGTPYKYGGYSPKTGFDCSGFVDYVFRYAAHISLPHNAQRISRRGLPVKSSHLRAGDLVFYDTNRHAFSHVGIYIGDGRFIHAPSSGGRVRMENMHEAYWKEHYNGARRIALRD